MLTKILPIACHTDNVGPNTTYVAITGKNFYDQDFIVTAIEKGAKKIILEKNSLIKEEIINYIKNNNIEVIYVDNARKALSDFSADYFNYPSKNLKIIGVTGTKGKTTTVYLLEYILKNLGFKTARISSVINKILDEEFKSELTTPQADYLQFFLDQCIKSKIDYVVLESSAQALSLHRLDNIDFDSVIFTNFSQEHLEFYSTIEDYFKAKITIINKIKDNGSLILNLDDNRIAKLNSQNINVKNIYYSINSNSKNYINNNAYISAEIKDIKNLSGDIFINNNRISQINIANLMGEFNMSNTLAVLCFIYYNLHIKDFNLINSILKNFTGIPGRLEKHKLKNESIAIIDHAHTISSFDATLSLLSKFTNNLITIFGAGGDRDKTKRPELGKIATKYSNKVFITDDNPRNEDPALIIKDIISDIDKKYLNKIIIEHDRSKAIEMAYNISKKDTIIAILGKATEEYQIKISYKITYRRHFCELVY